MDLDRGIVKALFYDYPVDALVAQLDMYKNKNNPQQDVFLDILPQLMQWSKQEYTYTEANLLRIQTGGDWVKIPTLPTIYHPFDIIQKVADKLLAIKNDKPVVDFPQLFRWKETALYVGEDLLTTAFVAKYDLDRHLPMRNLLNWEDILRHNNEALNVVLDKGLADVHAHYYATADVFNLNWISLTNNIQMRKRLDNIKRPQEIELLSLTTEYPSTVKQQCVAAAYLRFVFYCLLLKPEYACFDKDGNYIEKNYPCKINKILTDPWYADNFALDLQAAITNASLSSLLTADRRHLDYCLFSSKEICDLLLDNKQREIVNLVFQGERQLMYKFFYGYYSHDKQCLSIAPYFYLYLLLKSKIRREFVQINRIKGFENFEEYQDRKDLFIPEWSPISMYFANIVQYSSTRSERDIIEPRVSPKNIVKEKYKYSKSMFAIPQCNAEDSKEEENKQLDVVVHFIKNGKYETPFPTPFNKVGAIKDGTRDKKYRRKIKSMIFDVLRVKDKQHVVGIDAASREIFCRPEVYGHVYRYAEIKGIEGKTYHAGEDFLDIPDGLRAIEEAILFLDLKQRSRIGHAMALGINVKEYYERRHYTSVLPLQNLLDECVWLYVRGRALKVGMSDAFEDYLTGEAHKLYNKIGYDKIATWNIDNYWQSMLLRGNDPEYINSTNDYAWLSLWDKTANSENPIIKEATHNNDAKALFSAYFFKDEIKGNGMQLKQHVWTDKEIVRVVEKIQEQMQYEISKKKIAIECCPTSNLKIGYIERYDQHPLLTKFYPIDEVSSNPSYPLIKSSINTDDRGVFHTSVYEEYSLLALALDKSLDKDNKRRYNEPTILRYINEVRDNSQQMAFVYETT